jgi:hypothetical protein
VTDNSLIAHYANDRKPEDSFVSRIAAFGREDSLS